MHSNKHLEACSNINLVKLYTMTEIQPINILTQGIAKYLILKCLTLDMTATAADFYFELITDILPEYNNSNKVLASGNISMNENEFALWGSDNNYCIQWAADKLGLIIIK
jgi:hypothetical protein